MIEISITEKAGGHWRILYLDMTIKDLEYQLRNQANWIILPDENPVFGHKQRTLIQDRFEVRCYLADAIKFPDKTIWDSLFREFRRGKSSGVNTGEIEA